MIKKLLNYGCRLKVRWLRWCVLALEFPLWVHPFNIGDGLLCVLILHFTRQKNKTKFQIKDVDAPIIKVTVVYYVSMAFLLCSSLCSPPSPPPAALPCTYCV